MIDKISASQFREIQRPLNGVFVFTIKDVCPLCPEYVEKLEYEKPFYWTQVECTEQDYDWCVKKMLIHGFPSTKCYVDNMCVFDREGVLFKPQIDMIKKYLRSSKWQRYTI